MVVMFVAHVTSEISAGVIGEEIKVYGKKVNTMKSYLKHGEPNSFGLPSFRYSFLKQIKNDEI